VIKPGDTADNGARKVVGQATIRIKISIECDAWSDYDAEWEYSDRGTVDLESPDHFGWVIGQHAVSSAIAVCRSDNVCDTDEVLRGLQERLRASADEMDEWLPPANIKR
jgi:hypothetical protein